MTTATAVPPPGAKSLLLLQNVVCRAPTIWLTQSVPPHPRLARTEPSTRQRALSLAVSVSAGARYVSDVKRLSPWLGPVRTKACNMFNNARLSVFLFVALLASRTTGVLPFLHDTPSHGKTSSKNSSYTTHAAAPASLAAGALITASQDTASQSGAATNPPPSPLDFVRVK